MKSKPLQKIPFYKNIIFVDFCIGASIGALLFVLIYGISTLNPMYDSWIFRGYIEEDIIQRYAGWLYYRNAPWTWPLAVAENLSVPYGSSIVFTDSIPLASIFFKLFEPILPETFQFFGWYNLLNFVLQGGSSMLLIRHFKTGRLYAAIASLLFILSPVFIERIFRHDSLASQWILLFALLLYFKSRQRSVFPAIPFIFLCALAPSIHMYFLPLVYALFVVALLEWAIKHRQIVKPAIWFSISLFLTLVTLYALGILTRGGDGTASGFGSYSMNLNAFFNPRSFDWYAENDFMAWSRFLPVRPQNYRQYDGFNYLGLGVLFGLVLMLGYSLYYFVKNAIQKKYAPIQKFIALIKSHVWLLLASISLTLFAVSNVVYWDETLLFEVPLPAFVLDISSIFRASGRMFWLPYYLLILSLVLFFDRIKLGFPRWANTAVISFIVLVQVFDISGALVQKHQYFNRGILQEDSQYAFTSEGWIFLMKNYNTVMCLGNMFEYNLGAGIIRYNPQVTTNMILANRGSFPVITAGYEDMLHQLINGEPLPPDTLYLCSDWDTFSTVLSGLHPDARGYKISDNLYAFALPVDGNPLEEYLPASATQS